MASLEDNSSVTMNTVAGTAVSIQARRATLLRKVGGGALALVGFLLSPLSWWNDLIINIPLAYLFSVPFSLLSPKLFTSAFVVGYLLTNVLGFILMHHGIKHMFADLKRPTAKLELRKDLLWSLLYTAVIVALVMVGWIKPPQEYFGG